MTPSQNSLRNNVFVATLLISSIAQPMNRSFEELLQWANDYQEQCDNHENTIITLSPLKTRNRPVFPLRNRSNIPLRWHSDKHQEYYDNHTKIKVIGLTWDDTHEIEIPATAAQYSGVLKSIMDNPHTSNVDVEKLTFLTYNPCTCKELIEAIAHSLAIIDHTLNDTKQVKKLFSQYIAQLPEEMQNRLKVAIHNLEIKPLIRYYEKIPAYNPHPLNKKFKCDWPGCFYSSDEKGNLKRHRMIHAGEKTFWCCYCDYRANRKTLLKSHIKTHTGEKPYFCYCGKTFSQKTNLNTHMRIHTDEKPFTCDRCNNYTTNDKSNFNRHKRGCFA